MAGKITSLPTLPQGMAKRQTPAPFCLISFFSNNIILQ